MGGLLDFRMRTILASFHDVGIWFRVTEKLNISMKALMVYIPKCFMRKFEMPSWSE